MKQGYIYNYVCPKDPKAALIHVSQEVSTGNSFLAATALL